MSLTPAQVQILVKIDPIRAAMARLVEVVTATGPELQRLAETFARLERAEAQRGTVHRIHMQYRRKSRGNR